MCATPGGEPVVIAIILGEGSAAPTATPATEPKPSPSAVTAVYSVVNGTITAINGTSLTLQTADAPHSYALAEHVSVRLANRQVGTLADVSIGVKAQVYLRRPSDGTVPLVVGILEQ